MSFRWTPAAKATLRSALNNAWCERESFADAYGHQGPEAARARKEMARYERLAADFLGEELGIISQRRHMNRQPTISLFELAAGETRKP